MTELLNADDMKPGVWLLITDTILKPQCDYGEFHFVPNGIPWEIKAVSLPFIYVSNGLEDTTFYVPHFTFRRASRQYVTYYNNKVLPKARHSR
jgi:hypothetical protein